MDEPISRLINERSCWVSDRICEIISELTENYILSFSFIKGRKYFPVNFSETMFEASWNSNDFQNYLENYWSPHYLRLRLSFKISSVLRRICDNINDATLRGIVLSKNSGSIFKFHSNLHYFIKCCWFYIFHTWHSSASLQLIISMSISTRSTQTCR